jgi:hypothetical protein
MGLGTVISLGLLAIKLCASLPISYFWVALPVLIIGVLEIIFKYQRIPGDDIEV